MAGVFRSDRAEADLVDILVYLRARDQNASDRFETEFEARCHVLAQFPLIGRSREDLARSLRSSVVSPYVIFYRPREDGIEIIRVLHGARDLSSAFD
ncbi:MAG: type II toxin-antitoxin system RelE/ParE family toxin [Isosphaeraceae bacterium]